MCKRVFVRFFSAAIITLTGAVMITASFDTEARRIGGGSSMGRQSSNVFKQRQATSPPSAAKNAASAAPAAAAGATASAAAGAAKSGASRWLGPLAGIAAGFGIAALLSSLGLSGAFAEFLSSALLIAALGFLIMFILRRLRAAGPRQAMQVAGSVSSATTTAKQPLWREMLPATPAAPTSAPVLEAGNNWLVPDDFDTPRFLQQAKAQFARIQAIWDDGDTERLREFLTDDLILELKPQLAARANNAHKTEVVLLNAELLGMEAVSDGHLASVRFSGMLREAPGAQAFRLEEVWNLFKPVSGGWLLAGIQQIPLEHAS
jgi:predicted lipid-binding transport protein (Tim44 family)